MFFFFFFSQGDSVSGGVPEGRYFPSFALSKFDVLQQALRKIWYLGSFQAVTDDTIYISIHSAFE